MSMMKLLDEIVEDFEQSLDDCGFEIDKGFNPREEIEGYEREIEILKSLIEQKKKEAIKLGYACIAVGKPSELAPTAKMYIELHGQEAFDAVKRKGKAPEKFVWIK
jgi:hypothetical protein